MFDKKIIYNKNNTKQLGIKFNFFKLYKYYVGINKIVKKKNFLVAHNIKINFNTKFKPRLRFNDSFKKKQLSYSLFNQHDICAKKNFFFRKNEDWLYSFFEKFNIYNNKKIIFQKFLENRLFITSNDKKNNFIIALENNIYAQQLNFIKFNISLVYKLYYNTYISKSIDFEMYNIKSLVFFFKKQPNQLHLIKIWVENKFQK